VTQPLDGPRAASELYLARGDEVSPCRPIMTGDVFAGVAIPGVEEWAGDGEKLAMVVSHPCSMRQGPFLKPRLGVVRVVEHKPIALSEWRKRHIHLLPLPDLTAASADEDEGDIVAVQTHHAAIFELRGRVEVQDLDPDKRLACLSEEGVAYLHQRMGHSDTRYSASKKELMTACASVFAEMELWEEWNDALMDPAALAEPDHRAAELERLAIEFDQELSLPRQYGKARSSLRDDLGDPTKRPGARRQIAALRKARRQDQSKAG